MLTSYPELIKKYSLDIKGVIHLGASKGQEVAEYVANGAENIILVEAIPSIYYQLVDNTKSYNNVICINECLSDNDGEEIEFNVANNEGQSSSILEFDQHTKEHPSVMFVDKLKLSTRRMDSILFERGIDMDNYNYLSIDLQGAELMALKGMGVCLRNIDYIYCEVSDRPMYKDQPLIGDIDSFLECFGFERKEVWMTPHGWGDAIYIKKKPAINVGDTVENFPNKPNGGIIDIPAQFRPHHPFEYPKGNFTIFEEWFFQNVDPRQINGRIYLPIFWTSYYVKNNYGSNNMQPLQDFINSLDKSQSYFTIVQYDDGILNNLDGLDIKVFAMSGKRVDYPLPLIAMQHPSAWTSEKEIFCNFVGRLTHPIREQVFNSCKDINNWYVKINTHSELEFRTILAKSLFTLCPRGYGVTSFRIMEALEHGSIPVYISDEFIIPHGIEFNSYGVLIHISVLDSRSIESILTEISPEKILELQARGKEVFDKYYTYQANKKLILCNL